MRRYAIVGCGGRGIGMYASPLLRHYSDVAELVGLCDLNQRRMDYCNEALDASVPTFTSLDHLLARSKPDTLIVTSIDRTHGEFIVKALEAGCDAITEKPLAINEAHCRAILEAEERTGRTVTVTFNYRYAPHHTKVRQLVQDGAVGRVLSVDFHWYLDTSHGADYFRRWHRRMENSGGLLVHKASHHFDLVNWWLDTEPEEVFAQGKREFYGPTRQKRGDRCLTCSHTESCEFYFDIEGRDYLKRLYLSAEQDDGYHRDRCVFADEIDIYDTMAVQVRYASGALMSYSLNAFMSYEGYRLALFREGVPDPFACAAGARAGAMAALTGIAANRSIEWRRPVQTRELL